MATRKRSSKSSVKAKKPVLAIVESKATRKVALQPKVTPQVESRVAVSPNEARLSPELQAQVDRIQAPIVATPQVDPRAQARAERLKRKQEEMAAIEARRNANNTGVSVQLGQPKPMLMAAKPLTDQTSNGHITLAIPEDLKYKLLYIEGEYKKVSEPIRQNLKMLAQAKLAADIKQAIQSDEKCKLSATALEACVNEVLDAIQSQMPTGYAAVFFNTKEGSVVCKPAPELAGKRFQLG